MIRINGTTNSVIVNGTELSESELVALNGADGTQTINGVKTFTSSPILPTPTTDMQAATKKYVDDKQVTAADASQTVKGIIEIATDAEVQTGTDTTRAVTPAGMKAGLNATGTAPIYACRAWVNFNGTGTVAIRASGNVSSITDNGTGDYTVNFTTAMPSDNYAFAGDANSSEVNSIACCKEKQ